MAPFCSLRSQRISFSLGSLPGVWGGCAISCSTCCTLSLHLTIENSCDFQLWLVGEKHTHPHLCSKTPSIRGLLSLRTKWNLRITVYPIAFFSLKLPYASTLKIQQDWFEEQNAPKSITTLHNLARTVSGIRSCYTKIVCQIYSNTGKLIPPKKSPKLARKQTFPRAAPGKVASMEPDGFMFGCCCCQDRW